MSVRGSLIFGRYAFPPNRLGYCGPADHQTLFQHVAENRSGKELLELERRFEGAFPYLQMIADANGIADPFNERVVEAYWTGNELLESVAEPGFSATLVERYKNRMDKRALAMLVNKLPEGARPFHIFHVFETFLKAGLLQNPMVAAVLLNSMDSCRISWGKVTGSDGGEILAERPALVLKDGKLCLGDPEPVRVTWQIDGQGLAGDPQPDDYISIHWNWACEILKPEALQNLVRLTGHYLDIANRTF